MGLLEKILWENFVALLPFLLLQTGKLVNGGNILKVFMAGIFGVLLEHFKGLRTHRKKNNKNSNC